MLEGRVALVTESSGGIGAVIARSFADHGAAVAVHGRNAAALSAVRAQIEWIGARALQVEADLTRYEEVEALCERVEDALGPIDVLVAGAGVGPARPGRSIDDDWFEPADAGITATFYTMKAVLQRMKARRCGAIVMISPPAARHPAGISLPPASGKVGIQALTHDIAVQAEPFGIRVNCIVPRVVLAEQRGDRTPHPRRETPRADDSPRRHALADDVADAALYLASEASAWGWITGAVVDVDGGTAARPESAPHSSTVRPEWRSRRYPPTGSPAWPVGTPRSPLP